jgi:hypothetical protein
VRAPEAEGCSSGGLICFRIPRTEWINRMGLPAAAISAFVAEIRFVEEGVVAPAALVGPGVMAGLPAGGRTVLVTRSRPSLRRPYCRRTRCFPRGHLLCAVTFQPRLLFLNRRLARPRQPRRLLVNRSRRSVAGARPVTGENNCAGVRCARPVNPGRRLESGRLSSGIDGCGRRKCGQLRPEIWSGRGNSIRWRCRVRWDRGRNSYPRIRFSRTLNRRRWRCDGIGRDGSDSGYWRARDDGPPGRALPRRRDPAPSQERDRDSNGSQRYGPERHPFGIQLPPAAAHIIVVCHIRARVSPLPASKIVGRGPLSPSLRRSQLHAGR